MLNLEQEKENQALRAALVAVCNAATRGHCTGDVSLEFLLHVPAEAVKCYSELRSQLQDANSQLQETTDELAIARSGLAG